MLPIKHNVVQVSKYFHIQKMPRNTLVTEKHTNNKIHKRFNYIHNKALGT